MFGLVLLLLIVVPVVELYVLFQVADGIGWLASLGLLLLISLVGGALMRWQTSGAFGRITAKIREGKMPSAELVDGGLMIFGGSLLLTPGFFTDAVGLCMFIPPIRALARRQVLRRLDARVSVVRSNSTTLFGATFGTARRSGSFIDVDEVVVDRIPQEEIPPHGTKHENDG